MIERTNVEVSLKKHRSRLITPDDLMAQIKDILRQGDVQDKAILDQLYTEQSVHQNLRLRLRMTFPWTVNSSRSKKNVRA